MNILYLSPSFPRNYSQFPIRLHEAGAVVVGIGWEAPENLSPELKEALTEYCHVPEMADYDQVLRAAAHLISKVGKLDRVASQEEHWIDLEAALRLDFNVPGKKPQEILHIRHKSLMKEVFRKAAIPVAQGELAENAAQGRAFTRRVGYPIIAKPNKGVGAYATYKLSNDAELENFFNTKNQEVPYILEEFLEGYIQSFDGLTGQDGSIIFCASHQFSTDIMSAVNTDDHLHYWSARKIPDDLEKFGRQAIAAFDLRERFFHLEFIRGPKGRLTAMEINARPPGGLTMEMFNYANDIDAYRTWADVVVHGRCEAFAERPYHVSYIGRKTNKHYVHSHEQVLERYGQSIILHSPIDSVFRQAIGDYAYLARAPKMEELRPIVEFVQRTEN